MVLVGVTAALEIAYGLTGLDWEDASQCWTVVSRDAHGRSEQRTARIVVSAVGQLNRPAVTASRGHRPLQDSRSTRPNGQGALMYRASESQWSARARAQCRSFQPSRAMPRVTVVQRSPQWVASSSNYFSEVPTSVHWLMENVPYYAAWYRQRLSWITNE